MEGLAQLETLCERLYNSQDPAERGHAERTLQVFSSNAEYISQCQVILDTSSSPYAQHFASSSLVKQATDHTLSVQLRLDIMSYGVAFLASKGPKAQPFVVASLVQLICRICKLGWADDDRFRALAEEAQKFLAQGTAEHYYLGLKIFNQLILEMNQPNPGRSLTFHRKTACSFRDASLLQLFQTALASLRHLASADEKLREQAITLALRCLSFDFVGASMDESSEDLTTIQIPSSWRPLLEDGSTIVLFFEYYAANKPPISNQSLECLVRLASVRRSLFTGEAERLAFLSHLMNGTREILRSQQGLSQHENYHEYCRLLGRLKTNYQLSELVSTEGYPEWVQLVAEFTVKSLESWQWASGSVYYLLGLWSRLVSSMPYLKADTPSLLDSYVPQITKSYITSRLASVQAVMQNNIEEDPLDNDEQLQDQLDSLPYLCRFQYEKTSEFIIQRLDPILRAYTEASVAAAGTVSEEAIQIMEGQVTWLVHIIGAIIRGRLSNSNAESQEAVDGELSAKVFELIQVSDRGLHCQRYQQRSKQRLDLAILAFFQNFRRVYVGDQAMHSSKALYAKLAELLGLQDHLMVLNVMVNKIATNLKCYTKSDDVIEQTLSLFQELAGGYMSGKLLLKLEAVSYILGHHTADNFPFLNEYGCSRNRTVFYFTLGRLLFMEDSAPKFKAFMAPLKLVFKSLESTPDTTFRTPAVKLALIGLMRDLRGVTMATNSRRTFGLLFDWLYPAHMPILGRAIEHYTDTPEVTTPLLKFFAEFVLNKTQRLTFDSSSPNGILLFKEVSKLIVSFGQRILALPSPPASNLYNHKYKGIWIALTILQRALAGNYVNFGVFELYGDRALADALDTALNMSLSIPLSDIMAFRKLGRAYFALLEVLCHNHTVWVIMLPTQTFSHIVASLDAGLKSLDVSISSQCASAVDNIAAYYFTHITAAVPGEDDTPPPQAALTMVRHLRDCPSLFPEILKTLFEIVLFDDCSNQWSLSRPMLSLILINEQLFGDLKAQILASQPSDQRQRLSECFDKLMSDVGRTLDSKNRDKFTQNLTLFRHDFRAK